MTDVAELLEEVQRAPQGPQIGAFFDFDGTLIAGYSASAFYQDRARHLNFGGGELVRSLLAGLEMAVRGADVSKLMEIAAKCPVHRTLTSEINIRLRAASTTPAS